MTYTLQQLEELKYVKIEADPADARAKIVRVTKAGVRAREDAIRRVDPGMRALIDALGASAFADALPFLVKLRQILDATRD
jgi:DNA-binding MarR family transcriptional regulator